MTISVLVLTALMQLAGITAAVFLSFQTKRWYASAAIALSIALASRRTWAPLYAYTVHGIPPPSDLRSLVPSLIVPTLLLIGLWLIIPFFRRTIQEANRSHESRRTLSTLLSNLPGMAYRCLNDRHWTMQFVSEGCLDLTGYEPHDLLHNRTLSYAFLIHADDREGVWNDVQSATQQKRPFRLTYRIHTASGQEKWVWEQGRGIFSDSGELTALEGFITDITERKRSELRLRESEQRFRQVAENLRQIFYLASPSHDRFLYVSPAFASIWGIPCEALNADPGLWLNAIHPEDRPRVRQILDTQREAGGYSIEYRVVRPDGSERWVLDRAFELKYSDGTPHSIVGIVDDITERKCSELQLRESEERFRQIADHLRDVFWLTDWTQRKVVYVSKAYETIWGRSCQSLYDNPKSWRDVIHPDDYARTIEAFDQATAASPFDVEYRIVRGDGTIRWIHDRAFPILGPDGKIQRMAGFSEDCTQRKEAELLMKAQREEYETVFHSVPAMIWYKDRHNRILRANEATARALGLTVSAIEGQSCYDLFPDQGAEFHRSAVEVIESGQPKYGVMERYHLSTGKDAWVRSDKIPYRDGNGHIQGVIVFAQDISDQMKAEEALRESEQRFRSAFEHAPIGMCLVDLKGRFLKVNQRLCDMLGYSEDELLATNFQSLTHPDDLETSVLVLSRLRSGESSFAQFEKRYRHREGHEVWTEVCISTMRRQDGRPEYFITQVQNITERKQTAEKLREREEQYRTLAEGAQDSIFVIDPEDRVEYVNGFGAKQFGESPGGIIGRKRSELFPRQVSERQLQSLQKVLNTGESLDFEGISVFQGAERWLHTRLAPLHDENGRVRAVLGISRDITDRQKSEQALQRSEELSRWIVESIPCGIAQVDADGFIRHANPEGLRIAGLTYEQATSMSVFDFASVTFWEDGSPCSPDDYPVVQALRTGRPAPPAIVGLRRPDGEMSWAIFQAVPTQDVQTAQLTGAIIAFLDITERKRADELRRERDAAEAANRTKSKFLGDVSHELRTPITAFLGATELLTLESQDPSERRECVDMILRNGKHLLSLVNDLLDMSRIEAGTLDVTIGECSLAELMADIRAVTAPLHVRSGVEYRFLYQTAVPRLIRTDPNRMKQALINLIGNALKFTDAGHVQVSVAFDRSSPDGTLTFTVEDTGIGIRRSDQARVFQAFTQIERRPGRVKVGAGLGLTLARWVVEQLGGSLHFESAEDQGSRFRIQVPVGPLQEIEWVTLEDARIPVQGIPIATRHDTAPCTAGRVLIAEDAADVRSLLTLALRRAGAEVVAVENGEDAVRAASKQRFDLTILDIRMPLMTGLEAVKKMREDGCCTPIIAMTASIGDGDHPALIDAGFDEVWPKPMSLEKMIEMALVYLPTSVSETGTIITASVRRESVEQTNRVTLESVRRDFQLTLSDRMRTIHAALGSADMKTAYESLHQLVGTAGMHGFSEVSDEALRLLKLIKRGETANLLSECSSLDACVKCILDGLTEGAEQA